MNNTIVVERTAELIQSEIDGDLVALDVEQGSCFGFNATATRVWQMLDQPRSIDEIVASLTEEFAIDRAACEAAVVDLIDDFEARKLVRTRKADQDLR